MFTRHHLVFVGMVVCLITASAILFAFFARSGMLMASTELVGITKTTYAPQYSEWAFAGITIGDTDESVKAALGMPLGISTMNEDISFTWHYSESSRLGWGYYWERSITMDSATGEVIDKQAQLKSG